mmetsp:Transcript_26062/g.30023  ORF Transcript_26062/g.30023 Transcript_26062/m.30023 type:complete len:168 (-) Transcript_26062:185-688(-)
MRIKLNGRSMIRGKSQQRMKVRRGSPSHDSYSLNDDPYCDDRERHSEERHYPYQQYQERSHLSGKPQHQYQHQHQVNRYRLESVHSQGSSQGSVTRATTINRSNSDYGPVNISASSATNSSDHHKYSTTLSILYGGGGSLSSKKSYNSSLTGVPSFQRSLSTPDSIQ